MSSLLSSASASSALTVVVPPTVHCGGGYVEGEVLLNFRQLQEENFDEVSVNLTGNIHTRVRRNKHLYEEKHDILSLVFFVWTRGSAYPTPGTDVLRLPFRFPLPDGLPPSFHFRAWDTRSSVLYAVDTTGVRRGKFKTNKKMHTPIIALPKDEAGVGVRMRLGEGAGPGSYTRWKNVWAEERIRKGIWGEHATARVMVSIPEVPVLPLFTPLPFLITVTTMTAPMTRAKALSHPAGRPIFPAPPQKHADIDFRLFRNIVLCPQGFRWTTDESVACFFGAGPEAVTPDVDLAEKEWHPEPEDAGRGGGGGGGRGGEMGRWLQRTNFSSAFTLNVPPTFSAPTVMVNYYLSLKVPFPGYGNDILLKVPVTLTAGINQPLRRKPDPQPQPQPQPQSQSQSQPQPQLQAQPQLQPNRQPSPQREPKPEVEAHAAADGAHADMPDSNAQCALPAYDLGLPPEYWEAQSEYDGGRLEA